MTRRRFDVLALGNAIVDVVAGTEDDLLERERLSKGTMTLIDESRADALVSLLAGAVEISGGSAANTAVGVASLGGRAAFIGKVKDDRSGRAFGRDIRAAGVHFQSAPALDGPATARCIVLVTPDGERTMATFLGACQRLNSDDVDRDLVEQSSIVYLEGYLWDPPDAKEAFRLAARIAHEAGSQVALSLSDPFCVDRYRNEFLTLITGGHIDVLFANQHELKSLYQTADLETAISALQRVKILAAVTKSEDGCCVVDQGDRLDVPALPVARVTDATGAGDLFASGFLLGLCRARDREICARLGALAASEAISHFGARPDANLEELARRSGLLS